jgi:hypothetical protein
LSAFGSVGAFGFYAGLNVAAFVMIFFLMPGMSFSNLIRQITYSTSIVHAETKQRTLEELDYVFAVPTSTHASYQVRTFLPYWIRRYVLRQNVQLKPLYQFDEVPESKGSIHSDEKTKA